MTGSFLLGELDTGRGRARIRKGYVLVLIMLMWAAVDLTTPVSGHNAVRRCTHAIDRYMYIQQL